MNEGIFYLMLMMISAASYSAMQKLASQQMSAPLVVLISTSVVTVLTLVILFVTKVSNQPLLFSAKGVPAAILIGVFATGIEFFAIMGYSKNIPLTVAQPVTQIVYISMIILYGKFLFHEGITTSRLVALLLAAVASYLATK